MSPIESFDNRVPVITVKTNIGPILLATRNVYMPTDYGDADSHERYVEVCAKKTVLYIDCDAVHLVVMGDLNCNPGARFYDCFMQFASDNKLMYTDINRLSNVTTYLSNDGLRVSWIDHILCSESVDKLVAEIEILYDFITSDHKPIVMQFEFINGEKML